MLKLIIFTSNNKDLEILLNFKQKSMHVIIHSLQDLSALVDEVYAPILQRCTQTQLESDKII